ncbi:MAG: murein biosynthesis integral membrane protein MurJ [Candidatus Spechtbacterales bacterium]
MRFSILNTSTRSVTGAALILAASVLVSRFLGLIRDRILAGIFGAGIELDTYFAAFRIPDLIYSVIIGGAITSAFIPVFINKLSKDEENAWKVAQSFFYIAGIGLGGISLVMFLLMPLVMPLVVPGFDAVSQETAVQMSRIMLLSPIFLGLSSVFSGILHSFRKFLVYSLAPIFYNIGIVIGAVWLTKYFGINGLAWGVVLGAFGHMAIQAPVAFASGLKLTPFYGFRYPEIRHILGLMAPRSLGLAAYQINLWVITAIASTLVVGSLTVFNLANNLHYLPIGLIGVSFATAVFPNLSSSISREKYQNFLNELSKTLRGVFFLVFPVSILFFVLRAQIVRIVLGTGEFSWEATRLTAAALGAFSFGIFAYALLPILSKAFYAQENTRTPVIASVVGMAANVFLSVLLIYVIFPNDGFLEFLERVFKVSDVPGVAVIGLPLAFSISGILSLALLFTAFFKDKRNVAVLPNLMYSALRIIPTSFAAGFLSWLMLRVFAFFFASDTFLAVFLQAAFASLSAMALYLIIAYKARFREFDFMVSFLSNRFKLKKGTLPIRADQMDDFHGDSGAPTI